MNLYDIAGASARYDAARNLPEYSMRGWMKVFKEVLPAPPVVKILDWGCGTGRFSEELANTFGCPVIGMDPSISHPRWFPKYPRHPIRNIMKKSAVVAYRHFLR
jgi:hypothetical protein